MTTEDSIYIIKKIRRTLLLGLQNMAELERLDDVAGKLDLVGESIPDGLRPIASGALVESGEYAEALSILESLEDDVNDGKLVLA